MRPFVTQSVAVQNYKALILPYFDYCGAVWDGLGNHLADKVQDLQNRAARVILRASYDTSSSDLRNRLHWDSLCIRRKKLKAVLMCKFSIASLPRIYIIFFNFATRIIISTVLIKNYNFPDLEQIIIREAFPTVAPKYRMNYESNDVNELF